MKSSALFAMFGLNAGDDEVLTGVCDGSNPIPNHVCFLSDAGSESLAHTRKHQATIFIVPHVDGIVWPANCLPVSRPRNAYAVVSRAIVDRPAEKGVASTAQIHPDVEIGDGVAIGHYAVIDSDVTIGQDTIIGSHVRLHEGVQIGQACEISDHASIGTEGFGFEVNEVGEPIRIAHVGGVIIGDRVEIGTHVVIAQGTIKPTRIADDVKIDDAVFIAHNVQIGARSFVIAGATICGSVVIGSDAWISPASTVINKVTVGDGALVGLGAVVVKSVDPGSVVTGVPARPRGLRK